MMLDKSVNHDYGDVPVVVLDGVIIELPEDKRLSLLLDIKKNTRYPPRCTCTDSHEPLSVCVRRDDEMAWLRAFPGTKMRHAVTCRFYAGASVKAQRKVKKVIGGDGVDLISGELSLSCSQNAQAVWQAQVSVNSDKRKVSSLVVGLDELFDILWKNSGLEFIEPDEKRVWIDVIKKLDEYGGNAKYNGCILSSRICYLGGPGAYVKSSYFYDIARLYKRQDVSVTERFFVVCAISKIDMSLYSPVAILRGAKRGIYCSEELIRRWERYSTRAIETISVSGSSKYCIGLLCCYWSSTGRHLKCTDGVIRAVDKNFMVLE